MRESPRSLLLEIEGVLIDATSMRRDALRHALAAIGATLSDEQLTRHADGRSFADASARAVRDAVPVAGAPACDDTDAELTALRAERAFETALSRGAMLIPGTRDALLALATRLRLGVVTRLPRASAESILALAGLEAAVQCVVGPATPGAALVPADYARALARLSIGTAPDPRRCIALVDSSTSAGAARAAGISVVMIGDGAQDATSDDPRLASIATLTYDALVHLLASRGVTAR